jgi:methionyl-tRNA formyltransferase
MTNGNLKRVVFMGSPAFAVPSLRALHGAGHEIMAVFSQPPRPAGRGQKLQKTAVHEVAEELGLPVFTPEKLRGDELEAVMGIAADVFCVVGFGMMLPAALVEERVCINVHPSALPRWRGATPVQSAIMAGDASTDVCIMRLEAGMDTGPVYDRTVVAIPADMTTGELNDVVWAIGAERLLQVVETLEDLTAVPQVGEASRAFKITAEMRPIDWSQTADEVHNKVRGLSPAPGATASFGGEVFKILRTETVARWTHKRIGEAGEILGHDGQGFMVACGKGAVKVLVMQRAGGKAGHAAEVARGWAALKQGVVLA